MYLVTLKDQLGNQMFAYAAIKCLAVENNIDFGVIQRGSYYQNSNDIKYGNSITSIFPEIEKEIAASAEGYNIFKELPLKKRKGKYWEHIHQAADKTLFDGHFISSKYFSRPYSEIRNWFSLPSEVIDKAIITIQKLKEKNNIKTCCSVHFRVGDDYKKLGYLLNKNYWINAAEMIKKMYSDKCLFVVFYDKKTKEVENFIKRFNAEEIHGSLVDDMSCIIECDYHIVCNSTFSIMTAFLSKNDKCIIRPEKYYSGVYTFPDDVFPEEWLSCKCNRNKLSYLSGIAYKLYVTFKCK